MCCCRVLFISLPSTLSLSTLSNAHRSQRHTPSLALLDLSPSSISSIRSPPLSLTSSVGHSPLTCPSRLLRLLATKMTFSGCHTGSCSASSTSPKDSHSVLFCITSRGISLSRRSSSSGCSCLRSACVYLFLHMTCHEGGLTIFCDDVGRSNDLPHRAEAHSGERQPVGSFRSRDDGFGRCPP